MREARLFFGASMRVIIPEPVSCFILRYGFYEEGLTTFLWRHLKPGMVFVDVGAHIGYYTILASRIIGSTGRVDAFEPSRSVLPILRQNVGHLASVYIHEKGVFSTNSILDFQDFGLASSAFNSIYKPRIGSMSALEGDSYPVETICLDEYLRAEEMRPDFIKIDAETSEYEILQGMRTTLREVRPMLSLEVGDVNSDAPIKSKQMLLEVLRHGYRPFTCSLGILRPHELADHYGYDNLILMPEERCHHVPNC